MGSGMEEFPEEEAAQLTAAASMGPDQAEQETSLVLGPSNSLSFRKGIDENNTILRKLCWSVIISGSYVVRWVS